MGQDNNAQNTQSTALLVLTDASGIESFLAQGTWNRYLCLRNDQLRINQLIFLDTESCAVRAFGLLDETYPFKCHSYLNHELRVWSPNVLLAEGMADEIYLPTCEVQQIQAAFMDQAPMPHHEAFTIPDPDLIWSHLRDDASEFADWLAHQITDQMVLNRREHYHQLALAWMEEHGKDLNAVDQEIDCEQLHHSRTHPKITELPKAWKDTMPASMHEGVLGMLQSMW